MTCWRRWRKNAVVIVPVGSVEQHGPHCPQDVDISMPYHMAIEAAAAIDDFPVIVAPPISLGFTHYNMGEMGTITLSLWRPLSKILCESAARSGRMVSAASSCSTGMAVTSSRPGTRRSSSPGRYLGARADLLEHGAG